MPKNRVTQSKLKHKAKGTNVTNIKNTVTRKNKISIGGGEPIAQQILNVKHRDDFRSMFNNTFHVIYKTQTDQDTSKYEENVKELMRSMKRLKSGINTLIPITADYMPINKKIYKQSVTPLIGFVPFLCVIIRHLNNVQDVRRIIIEFNRNSGNINLASIKGNITALSAAIDVGNVYIINELIQRGADTNTLTEDSQTRLQQLIADEAARTPKPEIPQQVVETIVEPATEFVHVNSLTNQPQVEEPIKPITPLNIYNGTPLGVPQDVQGQPLPINQLKGNPPTEDCSVSNVHRCKQKTERRQKTVELQNLSVAQPTARQPVMSKLSLPFELPGQTGYPLNAIPAFWAPIFNKTPTELTSLRDKIKDALAQDNVIPMAKNEIQNIWSICEMVQTMIPTYYVPTKNAPYWHGNTMYADKPIDFTRFNMTLCTCLIIFGILSDRMAGQDYEFIFKGGKAIQLELGQISGNPQYISEDIDILVRPAHGTAYNRDVAKNLASHIGYLIKWFLTYIELPVEVLKDDTKPVSLTIAVALPDVQDNTICDSTAKANPNIVKISYNKIATRICKALADIDFKETPAEVSTYFEKTHKYPFHIDELQTDVLFICPNIGSLIDEKIYLYAKYTGFKLLLEAGKKILDEGYETVNLDTCRFYREKFSKALLALTLGLVRSRQPGLLNASLLAYQMKFVEKRLDAHKITDPLKPEIMKSLFPPKTGEDA